GAARAALAAGLALVRLVRLEGLGASGRGVLAAGLGALLLVDVVVLGCHGTTSKDGARDTVGVALTVAQRAHGVWGLGHASHQGKRRCVAFTAACVLRSGPGAVPRRLRSSAISSRHESG